MVGSVILGIRGYQYYSYSQGTKLLVSNTNAVNMIKNYPTFLIISLSLAILGIFFMIIYNIMLACARRKIKQINKDISNYNPFG